MGVVVAALLGGCLAAPAAPPEAGRVSVSITPGKPGAPTETVTVAWKAGSGIVRAERRSEGEVLASGDGALDAAALADVWRAVEKGGLTAFEARPSGRKAFDYGSRRVGLEWAHARGESPKTHEISYTAPIEDEEPVRALYAAVAAVARKAAPGVLLAYFP